MKESPRRRPRLATALVAGAGLAALVLLAACRRETRGAAAAAAGTPVVLLSIDTLRADHLPAYGYAGVQTPHLDALRTDAVLVENAYSHCPLTLPSHLSMLTGLLPAGHGVRDNAGYRFDARAHRTLPAALHASGYATAGMVSAYVLRRTTGLGDAFDTYDDVPAVTGAATLSESQRPAVETLGRATAWLATVRDRPFFLFLHFYEPHAPYAPPEPFRSRWGATYDGEIAAADQATGELVAFLKKEDLYDRALVVVVGDHGEGLGDHGEDEHGILLYREALHVPLLVKLPGRARGGTTLRPPVGLKDLPATIASAAGVSWDGPGRNILSEGGTSASVVSETYYPRIHLGWSELRSVVDERYHYIDGPRPELYDVLRDPRETTDLAAPLPAVARAMREGLSRAEASFTAPGAVPAEERERLAALGYLAGGGPGPAPATGLANPRDHIGVRKQMSEAVRAAREGRDAEAVAALDRLLSENPRLFDARTERAAALGRLGRADEAVQAYEEAARLSPELAGSLSLSIARLHLEQGRLAQAKASARGALQAEPEAAHEVLARVALASGQLEEADAEARLAAADPALKPSAWVVRAEVAARHGGSEAALALLEEARTAGAAVGRTPVPNLDFVRGDVLGRMGRSDEAQAALREEIRHFPGNARAYASLAILAGMKDGSLSASRAILNDMYRAQPRPAIALLAAKTLAFMGDEDGATSWRRQAAAETARKRASGPRAEEE